MGVDLLQRLRRSEQLGMIGVIVMITRQVACDVFIVTVFRLIKSLTWHLLSLYIFVGVYLQETYSMKDKISEVVSKFATSFDLKDWQGLEETLAESIECDYRDLRGTSGCLSKHEYVSSRKKAINELQTQHLFSNFEIVLEQGRASCRLNAVIFRRNSAGVIFNSHVVYRFHLRQMNDKWKIDSIKQSLLWNEGDSTIHIGVT